MSTDHIVLPVTALKREAPRVFESLAAGRTVYVSRHGDIIAAFRPIDDVPMAVAASYVVPGVGTTAELTARGIQQAVPSQAVKDAADGLPSLVTRDRNVYGVLTEASAPPAPSGAPDLEAAASRSDAMREYLDQNPDAPIEQIVAHRMMLDEASSASAAAGGDEPETVGSAVGPDAVDKGRRTAVADDLAQWRSRGSAVEQPVEGLFSGIRSALANVPVEAMAAADRGITDIPAVRTFVAGWRAAAARDSNVKVSPTRFVVTLRNAAGLVHTSPVEARELYVGALATESEREPGLMWQLGDLARLQGYRAEASEWYRLALNWERHPETVDNPTDDESTKDEFDIALEAAGDKKVQVIKAVREFVPGLGLKEAKDLIDATLKPLLEKAPKEGAEGHVSTRSP